MQSTLWSCQSSKSTISAFAELQILPFSFTKTCKNFVTLFMMKWIQLLLSDSTLRLYEHKLIHAYHFLFLVILLIIFLQGGGIKFFFL